MVTLIAAFVIALILGVLRVVFGRKHFMKFVAMVVVIIAMIYYDFWEDVNNKDSDSWKQQSLYSIRLKDDVWTKFDIRIPTEVDARLQFIDYDVPIPHRYQLEREAYTIDVEVNPTERFWPMALQMLTTSQSDSRPLRVESSWNGNCGIVGNTSNDGDWDSELDKGLSMGHPYFTNPKAVGFLWADDAGYCKEDMPQTVQHASSFPIILKIYDGPKLIGEEQIDFEIFENGIRRYILML
jgi:hypothetical protein